MSHSQNEFLEENALMDAGTIGRLGENAAAGFLINSGYTVIERNYRTRFGEIDIIAKNKDFLVFAEVKTRKIGSPALAAEYVGYRKQLRLIKTAQFWLSVHESSLQPRFDVLEVYYEDDFEMIRFNHIPDAFGIN